MKTIREYLKNKEEFKSYLKDKPNIDRIIYRDKEIGKWYERFAGYKLLIEYNGVKFEGFLDPVRTLDRMVFRYCRGENALISITSNTDESHLQNNNLSLEVVCLNGASWSVSFYNVYLISHSTDGSPNKYAEFGFLDKIKKCLRND